MQVRNDGGTAIAYTALGTARSGVWRQDGVTPVTFCTRPTTAGTVQIFRVSTQGKTQALGSAIVVNANAEDIQTFLYPFGQAYALFTDTSNGTGTVVFEVVAADRGLTG